MIISKLASCVSNIAALFKLCRRQIHTLHLPPTNCCVALHLEYALTSAYDGMQPTNAVQNPDKLIVQSSSALRPSFAALAGHRKQPSSHSTWPTAKAPNRRCSCCSCGISAGSRALASCGPSTTSAMESYHCALRARKECRTTRPVVLRASSSVLEPCRASDTQERGGNVVESA